MRRFGCTGSADRTFRLGAAATALPSVVELRAIDGREALIDPARVVDRAAQDSDAIGVASSEKTSRRWTTCNHRVTQIPVDAVAQALADPIRREILVMLREAPRTAGAIAAAFSVSRPAVSRHLRVLREAGLVRDTVSGREREYALDLDVLAPLEAFLAKLRGPSVWSQRLDALETEVHRVRRRREAGEQATENESRTRATKRKTA